MQVTFTVAADPDPDSSTTLEMTTVPRTGDAVEIDAAGYTVASVDWMIDNGELTGAVVWLR